MSQQSLAGMIKEISQRAGGGTNVMSCTVQKTKPLKLKFEGDTKVTLDKDSLIIPAHIKGLSKGKKVSVVPVGDGDSYMIVGRG